MVTQIYLWLIYHGHIKVVELLIENSVDINIYNDKKCSALIMAYKENYIDIVKLLIKIMLILIF